MILWQQEAIAEFDFRPEYFLAFIIKQIRGRGKIDPENISNCFEKSCEQGDIIRQYIPYRKAYIRIAV